MPLEKRERDGSGRRLNRERLGIRLFLERNLVSPRVMLQIVPRQARTVGADLD